MTICDIYIHIHTGTRIILELYDQFKIVEVVCWTATDFSAAMCQTGEMKEAEAGTSHHGHHD